MILLLAMLSIVLVKAILERLGLVVGVHRILRNVEVSEGHAQGASYGEHADVVAGKLNGLASADQRALLSSPSSARSSCNGATAGGVGGGADEVGTGGVSQPFRTASAISAVHTTAPAARTPLGAIIENQTALELSRGGQPLSRVPPRSPA